MGQDRAGGKDVAVRASAPRQGEAAFRPALLAWYDERARSLPWRRDRNPYRVWVAEVMLQQTRIGVVVPAYRRFLRTFPTVERLARADEEDVLALWSGLGYYTRARALHSAARVLGHNGQRTFPRTMEAALELPGVGPYTAAAVLSIAYQLPHAAVDGNVRRVLSRLRRLPPPDGRGQPHCGIADRLLDRQRPGDWNQALMELGETICLPRLPRCGECPVSGFCKAYQHGRVALYPAHPLRRTRERIEVRMTVVRDRRRRLLLERGKFPYLSHLWLPPIQVLSKTGTPIGTLEAGAEARGSFRHAILHRIFVVRVYTKISTTEDLRRRIRNARDGGVERRLFAIPELATIGRSSLLTKALTFSSEAGG